MLKVDGFGYEFDPNMCDSCGGKCCTGESGYIWLNADEMVNLADFLNISVDELKLKFLQKFGYKFSIKETKIDDGYACVFFDQISKKCQIYDVRPTQCRTFPFWNHFQNNLKELEKECVGVKFL